MPVRWSSSEKKVSITLAGGKKGTLFCTFSFEIWWEIIVFLPLEKTREGKYINIPNFFFQHPFYLRRKLWHQENREALESPGGIGFFFTSHKLDFQNLHLPDFWISSSNWERAEKKGPFIGTFKIQTFFSPIILKQL